SYLADDDIRKNGGNGYFPQYRCSNPQALRASSFPKGALDAFPKEGLKTPCGRAGQIFLLYFSYCN
ncbi:MAG: hypothetical protein II376_01995, partial [Clostridia bacterium]|nr:hypothetical protein [Clostridia bacterium]